jgi:hypothetical protein
VIDLDETIWSLTLPPIKHISGSKNFRSPPQKDFRNNIGTFETSRRTVTMSVYRGRPEVIGAGAKPTRMTRNGQCDRITLE